jgi:hypothetical protein
LGGRGVADSHGDQVGLLEYEGHLDCYSVLNAADGSFGESRINGASDIDLERCAMDSIVYAPDIDGYLELTGCLVRGSFRAPDQGWYGAFLAAAIEHNTILGNPSHAAPECRVVGQARSNVILGSIDVTQAYGLGPWNNDVLGDISAPGVTLVDNAGDGPLFCDAETGDCTLQDCSPCLGAAHDGGDIGAFGVGCECEVAVEDASWGRIKSLFR